MSAPSVERIADAVLYEGYLLYPYRASALKNRQRFNFGVIEPGGSAPGMQTQCLATGGPLTSLSVKVRCLRLVQRAGGSLDQEQEASECEMRLFDYRFAELEPGLLRRRFQHPATRTVDDGVLHTREPLDCEIEVSLEQPREGLFRICVRISNTTPPDGSARDRLPARSLLSAHTILRIKGGEFVSLLEPPAEFQEAAAACRNVNTWPVLAGEPGARDALLSSPIILYDYPQIAPESPGDLFDCAEIDEILSLRILTLTDEEKLAMRADARTRLILERTENLTPEHFLKMHGVIREAS